MQACSYISIPLLGLSSRKTMFIDKLYSSLFNRISSYLCTVFSYKIRKSVGDFDRWTECLVKSLEVHKLARGKGISWSWKLEFIWGIVIFLR